MISSKTLNTDDPKLNCRLKGYEKFSPIRIILDKNLTIKLNSYIFKSVKNKNTIIFYNSSNHQKIFNYMRRKDILVNLHFIPVYLHPFYQNLGFKKGYCHNAEKFYSRAISIPMYPKLTRDDQSFIVQSIKESLKE